MSSRRPSLRNRITTSLGGNIQKTTRVENTPVENLGPDATSSIDINTIQQDNTLVRSGSTGKIFSNIKKPDQYNNIAFGIGARQPVVENIDPSTNNIQDDTCEPCSTENQFFNCGCKICVCDEQGNCSYKDEANLDPCKRCVAGEIEDLNDFYAPCYKCVNGQILQADPPAGFNACSQCWSVDGWIDTCKEKDKELPDDVTWKYECRINYDDPYLRNKHQCLPPRSIECPKPSDPCDKCVLTGNAYPNYYKFVPLCDYRVSRCEIGADGIARCVCKQRPYADFTYGACPKHKPFVDQSTCECICKNTGCSDGRKFVSNNEVCGCYCDKYEAYGRPQYTGQTPCPKNHRPGAGCECECVLSERTCRRYRGIHWGFDKDICDCVCDKECSRGFTLNKEACRCTCELSAEICAANKGLLFADKDLNGFSTCMCYHPFYAYGGVKLFPLQKECPQGSEPGFMGNFPLCVTVPLPSINLSASFTTNEGSQDGKITVTWEEVDDPRVTGYDVTVEALSSQQKIQSYVINKKLILAQQSYTFDAIAGTTYRVGVAPVTAAGIGEYSYTTIRAVEDYIQSLFSIKFVP